RKSAAVVALTGSFKENLTQRGVNGNKIAVVINGIDVSRYGPRPRDADLASQWNLEGRFVVGYVGTHGMAHGLRNVLNAAELLRDETDFRFLLVGSGAERQELFEEAMDRRLNNVVFMPPQAKENMPAVWSLCDVALAHLKDSPVFAGVIPSKIFEAMGMGLPLLLAAPEGEASRIIFEDRVGVCVPAEDPEALAKAALDLMKNEKKRRAFSQNSLKAAPLHSRERQARLMMNVLELAARGKGGQAGLAVSS
ncbi:MAG TPA: glycosyltransferase WbuB, partial [Rhodospirillales bacterium]|nr:glycosyltransferase WbuB [Rhodospirillales bacterium]